MSNQINVVQTLKFDFVFLYCFFSSSYFIYFLSFFFYSVSLGQFVSIAVVPQSYSVNIMDEHVLRGNAAIIKCHIPSFVIDFVYVSSWILDENDEITEIHAEHNGIDVDKIGI